MAYLFVYIRSLLRGSNRMHVVALVSIVAIFWVQRFCSGASDEGARPENNRKAARASLLSLDKIIFVHIGKAGGDSIRSLFKGYCEADRKKIDEPCQRIGDTALANRVTGYVHLDDYHGTPAKNAEAYLYNLRHPVDRMISAYFYEHPDSCLGKVPWRSCKVKRIVEKRPTALAAKFFKECFPTQNDLPLMDGNNNASSTLSQSCKELAQEVVNGKHNFKGQRHMYYNMHHFAEKTIDKYPEKSVLVIRTESLWPDLKNLDIMLGGKGELGEMEGFRDSHGSEKYKKPKEPLSVTDYGHLCCALEQEMNLYRHLIELAANLDTEETRATIVRTAKKCGFDSWEAMVNQCHNKHP